MTWTTRPRSEEAGIAFIRAGEGPLLVLLHGVGLRAEAWGAQIDSFSDRFEVRAPDLPGHGGSVLPEHAQNLSAYADALAACAKRPCVVIGHSMGAMIALDLAIRFPDRVRGVVALNAIHRRTETARQAVLQRADSLDGTSTADPNATLDRWFGTAPSPEREACRGWLTEVDPAGYRAAYRVFAQEDGPSDADLARLTIPALFMTGSREPNSTPQMSERMAALAPKGAAQIVEGAAHMMPMTHAQEVNAVIVAFAARCLT